jgi:hypothetical protein
MRDSEEAGSSRYAALLPTTPALPDADMRLALLRFFALISTDDEPRLPYDISRCDCIILPHHARRRKHARRLLTYSHYTESAHTRMPSADTLI